eukprot:scaffold21202_cov34-Attheya_sp.AAC.1
MVGSGTKLSFGAIRSQWCGVQCNRLAKEEGGLNEEDNWIRLHGSVQRGGVGGYLILAIGV